VRSKSRPIRTVEDLKARVKEVMPYLVRKYSTGDLKRLSEELCSAACVLVRAVATKPLTVSSEKAIVLAINGYGKCILEFKFGEDGRITKYLMKEAF